MLISLRIVNKPKRSQKTRFIVGTSLNDHFPSLHPDLIILSEKQYCSSCKLPNFRLIEQQGKNQRIIPNEFIYLFSKIKFKMPLKMPFFHWMKVTEKELKIFSKI